MTQKFDITNIDHWLTRQRQKKKPRTLAQNLEKVEDEFEKGNISQDKRDYAVNFLLEMEEVKNSVLDPETKAEIAYQEFIKHQKIMNQKKG